MNKVCRGLLCLLLTAGLFACDKNDALQANKQDGSGAAKELAYTTSNGTYCFRKVFKQDVTDVQLTILGDEVTGIMNWVPYEKDSARGTLKGIKNAAGELDLMYDYMIEGNQQTETKIMKIEGEKLMIKVGELLDPKNDGHLIYKDIAQAQYLEILEPVDCKNLAD